MLRCAPTRTAVFCVLVASWFGGFSAEDTLFQCDTDSSGYWHEAAHWDQGTSADVRRSGFHGNGML